MAIKTGRPMRVRPLSVTAATPGLILLGLVLAGVGAAMFFALRAQATSATTCDWGASSMTAYVDARGVYHQSEPVVTGCAP